MGGALSVILLLAAILCGLKVIKHEKSQQERIANLEGKISIIQAENDKDVVNWEPDGYNYLAIGNSITKHPINEYWWNECGMAASIADKDYVHIVSNSLNSNYYAYNFVIWETMSHDRGETLSMLDGILGDSLDLVTIQLSENATDLSTFETDFEELIRYVQKQSPKAQIIVVGDFWDEKKDAIKIKVCDATNVVFVGLDEIRGLSEYKCGTGTTVYDEADNPHMVEHKGVAEHPNDEGMQWIANAILQIVKK